MLLRTDGSGRHHTAWFFIVLPDAFHPDWNVSKICNSLQRIIRSVPARSMHRHHFRLQSSVHFSDYAIAFRPRNRGQMLKITLYEHYRANVTDNTLYGRVSARKGRLKLHHNFYNHGITPIVQHWVNDALLKNAKSLCHREWGWTTMNFEQNFKIMLCKCCANMAKENCSQLIISRLQF